MKQVPFDRPLQLNPKVNKWKNGLAGWIGAGYIFVRKKNNTVDFAFTKGLIKDAFNEPVSVFLTVWLHSKPTNNNDF